MEKLINQRLEVLKTKHNEIEADVKKANEFIDQSLARLNAIKGAIAELEHILSVNAPKPTPQEAEPVIEAPVASETV